jgi:hypothetical protein
VKRKQSAATEVLRNKVEKWALQEYRTLLQARWRFLPTGDSHSASYARNRIRSEEITIMDLSDILAPVIETAFLREIMGRQYLLLPGEQDKFSLVISWAEVNHILSNTGITFPRVRVPKSTQDLPAASSVESDPRGLSQLPR